jgi:nucleoside phosphorylase
LLVAAEGREFSGLVRRIGGVRLDWPVEDARAIERNGVKILMVANGPGGRLAGRAFEVALGSVRPDVVVSTGVCGALDEGLEVGAILVADRVLEGGNGEGFAAAPVETGRAFARGAVISVDRVAVTASDKRGLRELGAVAVEMEAAAIAARASRAGIAFSCVRAVSDTAREDLVLDFNAYRDREGRFSRMRIAAAAMRRPRAVLPGLLRLDRNTRCAAESLGDFLADCRF